MPSLSPPCRPPISTIHSVSRSTTHLPVAFPNRGIITPPLSSKSATVPSPLACASACAINSALTPTAPPCPTDPEAQSALCSAEVSNEDERKAKAGIRRRAAARREMMRSFGGTVRSRRARESGNGARAVEVWSRVVAEGTEVAPTRVSGLPSCLFLLPSYEWISTITFSTRSVSTHRGRRAQNRCALRLSRSHHVQAHPLSRSSSSPTRTSRKLQGRRFAQR